MNFAETLKVKIIIIMIIIIIRMGKKSFYIIKVHWYCKVSAARIVISIAMNDQRTACNLHWHIRQRYIAP